MKKLLLFVVFAFVIIPISGQGQSLPVMTYNIRFATERDGENSWEKRKKAMVQLLNEYKPVVIGTQEGLHHQLEYLTQELGHYSYIGVARDDGKQKGEYSAILYDTTRVQLQHQHTFWLHEYGDNDSIGWDAAMKRICTYGFFKDKLNDSTFWVFNAHFDHVGVQARKESARQIQMILFQLSSNQSRIIIMGDFNSEPGSDAIKRLGGSYDDGLKIAEEKQSPPLGTYTGFNPDSKLDRRIDYIFLQNFRVQKYLHLQERREDGYFISDHLPVLAVLKYRGE